MQEFNENNMLTKFIKNILKTTFIPTIPVWKQGKHILKDIIYITKDYIIRAKKSWPNSDSDSGPLTPLDKEYFEIIDTYVLGKFYNGFTSNYISNTFNYDAKTHYYLGNYLRMIRDLHDIDLMQYYNCWGGAYSDQLRIKKDIKEIKILKNNPINDNLKVLMVPIKFNQKYTIFGNCSLPIEICPIYFNGLDVYKIDNKNLISTLDNYKKISYLSFNQPFLYSGVSDFNFKAIIGENSNINNNLILNENNLLLLIQIPESCTSNFVVLEGDFSDIHLINNNDFKNKLVELLKGVDKNTGIYENIFEGPIQAKSYPALVHSTETKSHPFSDRLIEYLLLNVITKNDENSQNISRIQKYDSSYNCLQLNKMQYNMNLNRSIKGVWDNNLRQFNYYLVTNYPQNNLCLDINGYVDKDTEKIILRGKE